MADDSPRDRSIGDLVRSLMEDVSALIRGEIELAKLEMRESASKLGAGGALIAVAAVLALFAVGFLLVTLAVLLSLVMPMWAATLCVAIALLVVAVILAAVGREKLEGARFHPGSAIESVRDDIRMIRSDLERRREGRGDD